nr:isoform 2 of rhomboid-like protein 3 [Quercus suber]
MNSFVHHPLVILPTALEDFSYMMTCEITISVGVSGALFVLLGAMVSKVFTNWTIYANKVLTTCIQLHY